MKRLFRGLFLGLLTSVMLAGSGSLSQAQLSGIGIKGGFNYGSPIGKAAPGATGTLGLGAMRGIYARFRVTNSFDIQPEFQMSYKNAAFATPFSGDTTIMQEVLPGVVVPITTFFNGYVEGQFQNIYMELPVMGNFHVGERLQLMAGPYLAYLAHGSNEGVADVIIGENFREENDVPVDQSAFLNPWDYGIMAGAQFETETGINLGLRLTTGLRSVYSNDFGQADGPVRNVYVQGGVGYTLSTL